MKKTEAKAIIYNTIAKIVLGKATEKEIKTLIEIAQKHNLLHLIKSNFEDIGKMLLQKQEI